MAIKEIGCEAQDRIQWRTLVKTAMNVRVLQEMNDYEFLKDDLVSWSWLDFRRHIWGSILNFTIESRPALWPTQPPIQWVPGALSLGVKLPGREADHSPPSSTEFKGVELYLRSPNTPSWRGV
jgi:hypothetical protein